MKLFENLRAFFNPVVSPSEVWTPHFNDAVNKVDARNFLKKEIKEISGRWAQFMITKRAIEKEQNNWKIFTEEEETMCEDITLQFKMKDDEDVKKTGKPDLDGKQAILDSLPEGQKETYEEYMSQKAKNDALDNSYKGIKEVEEFLEIATSLKNDVEWTMDI